jgi:hypothetical protein
VGLIFQEDRIKTFYCDQLDRSSIRELWSHPDLQGGVDIIIEDGLHTFEANVSFLEELLDHLRPGGSQGLLCDASRIGGSNPSPVRQFVLTSDRYSLISVP